MQHAQPGQQPYGQPVNPYAAPTVGGPGYGPVSEYYRDGDNLVVRKGSVLPDICIATGVPTGGNAATKKLTWMPPWVAILCVLSPLIGLIVMLIVRKSGSLTYFVSREVQAKRKVGLLVGVGLIVGSFVLIGVGVETELVALALLGVVALLAGILVAAVMGTPYRLAKIDQDYIHLKVKPEFWAALQ